MESSFQEGEKGLTFEEFTEKYSLSLTCQQEEAVRSTEGPVLLLAVPGSGKTTVLVARLGYMIYCCKIPSENILTMTYTVAATADMKARFISIFGEKSASELQFRTINGVCARIIQSYERAMGKTAFSLLTDEKESAQLLSSIYKNVTGQFATESDIKNLRTLITYTKNMMLSDEEIKKLEEKETHFYEIYKKYASELRNRRLMDYDDQMVYAYRILQKYPPILERLHRQYPYICVDEAQDTSKIQHAIISLLAGKNGNLFMVGDEDQSIYGFRAAYPEALVNFEKEHDRAKVLLMEENFRSNANIVRAADKFISRNFFRHPKSIKATRDEGTPIKEIPLLGRQAQYGYILNAAKSRKKETAVLYRDNENVLPLVDLFERNNIPYRIKSADLTFFSHRVVQDISNIILFAYDPRNTDLFLQIYYKISTYLNKAAALAACELSARTGMPVLDAALMHGNLTSGTEKSCRETKAHLDSLVTERADNAVFRIAHHMGYNDYLDRMGIGTNKVYILESIGAGQENAAALLKRLSKLSEILKEKRSGGEKMVLSTIHSSKGLEYDSVYLLDVCDGVFPETIIKNRKNASEDDLKTYEEERRLFYVGVTRAKNELSVFTFGAGRSTFSDEILEKYAEESKARKSSNSTSEAAISQKEYEEFSSRFYKGVDVYHKIFGHGRVISREGDIVNVIFDSGSVKKLSLKFLLERGILK